MDREVIKYNRNRNINEYNIKDELSNKYFEALGTITFRYTNDDIEYSIENANDIPQYMKNQEQEEIDNYINFYKQMHCQKWIADMIDGEEFLNAVESGCFIDEDGTLSEIYVDGYLSNLGLCHEGINQGAFMVNGDIFREICKEHHVLVDWANK